MEQNDRKKGPLGKLYVGRVKLECTGGGKRGTIPAVMPVKCGHPTMTTGDVPKL